MHGAAPAARLGDAVSLPFRISTGHKHKHNRIPLGRLWLMSLLFLLQEPTSFVPRWCDGLIAGGGGGGLCESCAVAPRQAIGLIPSHPVTSHHSSSHCRSNEGDLAGDESARSLGGCMARPSACRQGSSRGRFASGGCGPLSSSPCCSDRGLPLDGLHRLPVKEGYGPFIDRLTDVAVGLLHSM